MGETQEAEHSTVTMVADTPSSTTESTTKQTVRKERRNGMWNIFEGVDSAVLEKLGLSEDLVLQLVKEADDTVSEHLSRTADRSLSPDPADPNRCRCRRARILRSFSETVGEEVRAALQNRRRRNAVGNLFEVLTAEQKLLLVEHLQEQLERLHCLCGRADHVSVPRDASGSDVILNLTDFTASSTTSSTGGSVEKVSSPSAQGEVLCH